jgi:beta-xylosidase
MPFTLRFFFCILCIACCLQACKQANDVSKSERKGVFTNPIIHADYSDPDVIRVGDDFYMTASSFNAVPGLPILHSRDLVNWRLIGHALPELQPQEHFSEPQHGGGVWAPAIRFHNNAFYIYYGDPDFGIYMLKANKAEGPWEPPVLVEAGKGLIDPCPLWDEDGKSYLVHAFAGSRAGIKSILVVKPMNAEGSRTTGVGRLVFDGHEAHPTVEGSKFYKKDGYYYIFAPAGGVSTGWQLVLRSENPYGPYEEQRVLEQGSTAVNGPHQGAWVELASGEHWFFHFQDKGHHGRIVHLQPMSWEDGWPKMGEDLDGNGIGEPLLQYKQPQTPYSSTHFSIADSDEFDAPELGLQWQWHANPRANWYFLNPGKHQLRLFTQQTAPENSNFWKVPTLLLQKFPSESFTLETKLSFSANPKLENEQAGLIIMGNDYARIYFKSTSSGVQLAFATCTQAEKGTAEHEIILEEVASQTILIKVHVSTDGICSFEYSLDAESFQPVPTLFKALEGKWIGAKIGLFAIRNSQTNDSGYLDADYFRFTKPAQ